VDNVLGRIAKRIRREHAAAEQPLDNAALAAEVDGLRSELETELLALARRWGPETLRVAIAHARNLADPDGASEAAMRAATEQTIKLADVGELTQAIAWLTHDGGAKLRVILDHYRGVRYHGGTTPSPDTRELDPVTGDPVTRTEAQRDADAFIDWIDATLDTGLGNEKVSERPHLDITASLEDLANGTGTAVLERTGTPVPATTTDRIACDADVRLVLVDGQYCDPQTGEPVDAAVAALRIAGAGVLDYGRSKRIVPMRLRRALAHRDRGCIFPGCHRPPAHTEAHHILHWTHGGETSPANCVLLCSRHHHFVHEGGWTITARPGTHWSQPGHWQFNRSRQR
jgi:hypothetical protein